MPRLHLRRPAVPGRRISPDHDEGVDSRLFGWSSAVASVDGETG